MDHPLLWDSTSKGPGYPETQTCTQTERETLVLPRNHSQGALLWGMSIFIEVSFAFCFPPAQRPGAEPRPYAPPKGSEARCRSWHRAAWRIFLIAGVALWIQSLSFGRKRCRREFRTHPGAHGRPTTDRRPPPGQQQLLRGGDRSAGLLLGASHLALQRPVTRTRVAEDLFHSHDFQGSFLEPERKPRERSWFLRMMVEKNGESSPSLMVPARNGCLKLSGTQSARGDGQNLCGAWSE